MWPLPFTQLTKPWLTVCGWEVCIFAVRDGVHGIFRQADEALPSDLISELNRRSALMGRFARKAHYFFVSFRCFLSKIADVMICKPFCAKLCLYMKVSIQGVPYFSGIFPFFWGFFLFCFVGKEQASQQAREQACKQASEQASNEARKQGSKEARKQGSKEARKQGSKEGSKRAREQASKQGIKQAREQGSNQASKQGAREQATKTCSMYYYYYY